MTDEQMDNKECDKQCHTCVYWHLGEGYPKPEIICNNQRSLNYEEATLPTDLCVQYKKRIDG